MTINRTKGSAFLIQETATKDVFTLKDLTEEQRMMRDSVSEFIDREVWPNKPAYEKKNYKLIEDTMKQLGEMGFLGVSVPESYGGLGMNFVSTLLVCDYVSGATGSLATAFGAHTGIGTLPILFYGTQEQRQKYLPGLATGKIFGAYCLTEPEAGSDANSGKTKAVLSSDGKHYEISGQKMWITNAGFAKVLIVFARIEDDKNLTAFIVDNDPNNGISLGEEEPKLGIRSSSTRQVFFSNTKIPVENLLGERNKGINIALNVLNVGRIKLGAACIDAQRQVINQAVEYANQRKQFKTAISQFGAIQEKIARMAADCFSSEAAVYRAGGDIDKAISQFVEDGLDHQKAEIKGMEEYAVECAILKVYASEAIQKTSDEGIQIFGGMGFSEETPMESAWRDARISRIYEGTNEINRLLAVGMLLKKAMKGEIDLLTPATAVGKELMGVPSFETHPQTPLAEEKYLIKQLKKALLMIAGKAVQSLGAELQQHQEIMLCLSDILIEIYVAESTLLAVEKSWLENPVYLALAQIKLNDTVNTAETKGRKAITAFTKGDEQKILLMGLKRFTKYKEYPNLVELQKTVAQMVIEKKGYCF